MTCDDANTELVECARSHCTVTRSVTNNVLAALPANDAPVPNDTEAKAMMSPTITADVFTVAELPTCQTTFLASAPFVNRMDAPTLMVSADPTWKMKFPFPLKVSTPPTDRSNVLAAV